MKKTKRQRSVLKRAIAWGLSCCLLCASLPITAAGEWLMETEEGEDVRDLILAADADEWTQTADLPDYPYRFSMWQYSQNATVDGVAGYVDLNVSFIDYSEK